MAAQPPKEIQVHLPDEQMNQYIKLRQEDERLQENLAKVSAQLESELRERRSIYITRREVMGYNVNMPVFRSLGKAFIKSSVTDSCASMKADLAESDKKVLAMKKTGISICDKQDQIKIQINELVKPFIKE